MNIREDSFYGRQSVDRKDSISIESQLEFSKHEFRGEKYRVYKDKGFSGKNTDRPKFQELLRDIERGIIKRVVVYKLDRISRSIIDFANMMEMFQKYNVEFISATEKFDTSTPMGRAMLNICIVFAQLERETIQRRVQDAYYSRCEKGFHMSGQAPFGYKLVPATVDGIKTKMMAVDPVAAEQVKLMFKMYADPLFSFGDIARHFTEQGINLNNGELKRGTLSALLRNPVYAQADMEMYEFFKTQGAIVVNDAADFMGTNGCYLYRGRDVEESKTSTFKDHIIVLAPHEGFVSSETWLACRKRLINNTNFGGMRKAKNSWLVGKTKCGRCGASLGAYRGRQADAIYLRCRRRTDNGNCVGCGTIRTRDIEDFIFDEMCKKMSEFKTLTAGTSSKKNPKLTALHVSLAQVEAEIEKLINTLAGANTTLIAYANSKIEELDANRQSLMKKIADLTAETVSPSQMECISDYLNRWDSVDIDDRRLAVDGLILVIKATSEDIQIEWKI